MYLENLPDELIEKIFLIVHQNKYCLVMKELIQKYENSLDMIVQKLIEEVMEQAINNVNNVA